MITKEIAYKYLTTRRSYKLDPNFKVISVYIKIYNNITYFVIKIQSDKITETENVYSFKTEVDKWIIDQRKEKLKILDKL